MIATTEKHLSCSQLKTYSTCSLKWKLGRTHKPETVSACLPFGRAIHAAIQSYHQARLESRDITADEMHSVYKASFDEEQTPVEYGKRDDRASLDEKAKNMLQCFAETVVPGEVIAVEEPIKFELDPALPPLLGFIDLIEVVRDDHGNESLVVTDWKTAARKPSAGDVDADQLILYGIALQRTGFLRQFDMPLRLEYRHLLKTKSPDIVTVPVKPSKMDAERLIEKARRIYRAMEADVVYPQPGWQCSGCSHRSLCQQWPNIPNE